VLVLNRFVVDDDAVEAFTGRAHAALAALAACPGYISGRLTRALDEPSHWCLVTEWESVGTYRRALGAFDVKVTATPLLAESLNEPSAYETLAAVDPGGDLTIRPSDRAGR
jgi:quinol monooxygenase YgiN